MAKPKIPNHRKANIDHKKRVERYAKLIQEAYDRMAQEMSRIACIAEVDPDVQFSFADYPLTRNAISRLQNQLMQDVGGIIMAGTSEEWRESNLVQDLVARKVLTAYTGTNKFGEEYTRYFQTNPDSLKAFQQRKDEGMNLASRVWDLSEQYKEELEEAISAAIAPGTSAVELAAQVKQYLKDPDKRFRRIRDKFGNLQLSGNAKAYHPGRGVYRSSARNAQRLARTEINMAYRTAEQKRWEQFDFVVGYEVKTTQNGHHVEDICDQLAGKYPKDFKFSGWHPQCYSDDSEVLTEKGWKLFKDVSKCDSILSLNPETREPEWVGIADMQCYDRKGDMIRFSNKSLDCLVTPEHRMVYLNKSNGEIRYCQAKDYTKGKGAFYRSANYLGIDRDFIEIEGRRIPFDYFCKFMGYYLSDGSLQHGTGVIIAQRNDQPAFDSILAVAKSMGYSPKVCRNAIAIYNSALNRYLSQFGICKDKFIPKEIKSASKRQIQLFLNAFIKCDGYSRKYKSFIGNHGNIFNSDKEERVFFTTSERLAGDLSELILKVGSRPSFQVQKPQNTVKKDGTVIKANYKCYKISECYAATATVFNKEVVPYSGKVYDLTLERNHIMYIRRNGKCFWGSNCMCYTIPILKTEDEFWALDEEQPSVNEVKALPDNFKEWINDNKDRIEAAEERGTLPYFIRDNRKDVDAVKGAIGSEDKENDIKQNEIKNTKNKQNTDKGKSPIEKEISIDNTSFLPVSSLEEAVNRAKSYGIESIDFTTASIEEVNIILEVFHKASEEYGIKLNKLWLANDLHKSKQWSGLDGFYDSDKKLLAINLSGFASSSFKDVTSYADKILKLENNKNSLLRQIEQSEARLGRSRASDRILKAEIKNFKSKILDIEVKIQKYDKLAKAGYNELPSTVADSFKEIKEQMQARIWHEIGHHLDDRLGRPRFKEGNVISEYVKEMRGEEFAEWFSQYKMRGSKEVPNDLLKIFRKAEYDRYGERKWQQLYFDSESGGYNVAHSKHQFKNSKPKGVPKTGGEAEKWLGGELAKQGKAVEFLPESGINGKSGDMRFDGKVWDCKYIPIANNNTVRSYIKDARKADRVIFCWEDESRLNVVRSAISSEVGNFRKKNRLNELPDIYWADDKGKLHLLWKK